jgi:hypothetical protein
MYYAAWNRRLYDEMNLSPTFNKHHAMKKFEAEEVQQGANLILALHQCQYSALLTGHFIARRRMCCAYWTGG